MESGWIVVGFLYWRRLKVRIVGLLDFWVVEGYCWIVGLLVEAQGQDLL